MSFEVVRPFFRTRLSTLNYREWDDGFAFDNIPSNLFDRAYHIESGDITSQGASHQVHRFDYPVIVRVFKKGFRNVGEAIDDSDADIRIILDDILSPANRLGVDIKDVVPDNVSRQVFGDTNDNKIIIEFSFTVKIFRCF